MRQDFKNGKLSDLEAAYEKIQPESHLKQPYLSSTDGCIGVPETMMGHTDLKGRNKSQLELLREDLPGTLMFNYTGKNKTVSKYLKR